VSASPARVEARTFRSEALGRDMRYVVWLPPGYDDSQRRYPALYLLHGMGGNERQWLDVGVGKIAEQMIRTREIKPFLIVMPDGGTAYWTDHANNGPRYGQYTAVDLVREVGSTFRVERDRDGRAIGGMSMGAHGALQLAVNFPGTYGAVGAHSLVLRRFGSAPAYFGDRGEYAKRDPMQLVASRPTEARAFKLWIDIGTSDPWAPLARQFGGELRQLGISHDWREWPGDHSGLYWSANVREYLRFYDAALCGARPGA